MNAVHQGVVTLLKSAVTGQALALPEGFRLEDADETVKKQGLLPLVYQGARNCGIASESEMMTLYQQRYLRNFVRSERQMRSVRRLCNAFEDAGIDYMILKGCSLKSIYPQPEMRPMGDADILIRLSQYHKIRPILEQQGYIHKGESQHELIWKNDYLELELHKCLFAPVEKDFYPYFGDGWGLARHQEGCRYDLSPEDNFVYLFTHMTKHYRYSGVGSRHILDLYVYRRAHPHMDENRIRKAMEQMGLLAFYDNIDRLLESWFEDQPADEKTEYISRYILTGGSWGDTQTRFETEQVKAGKDHARGRAIWQAIFPPVEKLLHDFPILLKRPKLYPLFWIPRWFLKLFTQPGAVIRKMKLLLRLTDREVEERRRALEYVGLRFHK